jgi:hypothetical protein
MAMKVTATRAENSGFVLVASSPVGYCRKQEGVRKALQIYRGTEDSNKAPKGLKLKLRRYNQRKQAGIGEVFTVVRVIRDVLFQRTSNI